VRRFALAWGRRYPERWVIGAPRPAWLDLVAPPDAAPLPPGAEPDVVIVPHTASGRPARATRDGDPDCGLSTLGRTGARTGSGLLDVFRDGDRPSAEPSPAPPPTPPGRDRVRPPLERTVVALGARTETLAAHLERLEGRLDRLAVDVRSSHAPRHDAR
jgi:hypothetical protein